MKEFFKKIGTTVKNGFSKTVSFFKSLVHEPPFRVAKKASISTRKALLIRVIAIVCALIFTSLLSVFLLKANPIKFLLTMFNGNFGSSRRIWKLLKDASVLLGISLAITPAFRMKFWNIGAEGQTLVGAIASAAAAFYLGGKVPNALLLVFMLLFAILAGAIWAGLPAIFKAIWNTNETLFTLMMNYVASGLLAFFLLLWTPSGSSVLGMLPFGHLPVIYNEYLLLIISVLVITVVAYIYLQYTKQGYEISVVGESENTAKYIGIKVGKVIIRTMLISGAICGLTGFLIVGALDHSVSETTVGGMGFTAIMVAWLAKFNPLIMIGTSLLITFLDQGAAQLSTDFNVASAFPDIVVGIILFFIIGCEFFINYSIKRSDKKKKEVE